MIIDAVEMILSIGTSFGFLLIAVFILASAVKVVPEYQRVVVFRLGGAWVTRAPAYYM